MPESGPVGNDVLAERLKGVREDVHDLGDEQRRMRERLHKLEGLVATLVDAHKDARDREEDQYAKLGLRVNIMTVVVAIAAIIVPVIIAFTGH